jgi:hypothetical protein
MGGIKSVYLANYDNVSGVTSSEGTISAIAKANNGRFYKFNLARATASATEEFNDDISTGTTFNAQTLTMIFNKMSAALRNQIAIMAQAVLVAVIEDRNGKYWYYGKESGLMRQGGSSGTGTAGADRNGYEVILTGEEREMAMEVSSSVITGLETP